jgi:hypothetical protein
MRGFCVAISPVTLLSSLGPSRATIMQPWCWDGTSNASGELECAFESYQQLWLTSRARVAAWQIPKSIRFRRLREGT